MGDGREENDGVEEKEFSWCACEISLFSLWFPCHMYSISPKGQEGQREQHDVVAAPLSE
jgi:hypothetical protein